jgi:hypothetical protein
MTIWVAWAGRDPPHNSAAARIIGVNDGAAAFTAFLSELFQQVSGPETADVSPKPWSEVKKIDLEGE